jgi:hypothetical protein
MGKFIHIKSNKFPVLPGEEKEIVNDGMYGKALAEYLQVELSKRGYSVPFVCAEDWGWWVELAIDPVNSGVCIYALPETSDPVEYVCTDGFTKDKKWSWSNFRFIETSPIAEKIHEDVISVFRSDNEVEIISITDEFPSLVIR